MMMTFKHLDDDDDDDDEHDDDDNGHDDDAEHDDAGEQDDNHDEHDDELDDDDDDDDEEKTALHLSDGFQHPTGPGGMRAVFGRFDVDKLDTDADILLIEGASAQEVNMLILLGHRTLVAGMLQGCGC